MLESILSSIDETFARSKPWISGGFAQMLRRNWHLGLTSFGGPNVHFQIVRTALSGDLKIDIICSQDDSSIAYSSKSTSG